MYKKLIVLVLLFSLAGLSGCGNRPVVYAAYEGDSDGTYKVLTPIMNAGGFFNEKN